MKTGNKSDTRPKQTRSENYLMEEIGDEIVVYNSERHRVHCLNAPAARIWRLCDGRRSINQIAAELSVDLPRAAKELVVANTISQLSCLDLVQNGATLPSLSRRQLAKKIGLGTLAAVAVPLITSVIAPTPARAASCLPAGTACSSTSQCCSGLICCGNNSHGFKDKCATAANC